MAITNLNMSALWPFVFCIIAKLLASLYHRYEGHFITGPVSCKYQLAVTDFSHRGHRDHRAILISSLCSLCPLWLRSTAVSKMEPRASLSFARARRRLSRNLTASNGCAARLSSILRLF